MQGNQWHLPLHLDIVAIEKGAFGLPSTTVTNFTFIYFDNVSLLSTWYDTKLHPRLKFWNLREYQVTPLLPSLPGSLKPRVPVKSLTYESNRSI